MLSLCLPYGPVHIDLSRFLPSLLLFFWDGNLFYTVCSTDYILYQYVLKWRYVGIYSVFIIKNLSNIIACSRSQLIVWGWCHFICNSCFVNIVLFRKFVLFFYIVYWHIIMFMLTIIILFVAFCVMEVQFNY